MYHDGHLALHKPGKHLLDIGGDPLPALVARRRLRLHPARHQVGNPDRLLRRAEAVVDHRCGDLRQQKLPMLDLVAVLPDQRIQLPRLQQKELLARQTETAARTRPELQPALLPA